MAKAVKATKPMAVMKVTRAMSKKTKAAVRITQARRKKVLRKIHKESRCRAMVIRGTKRVRTSTPAFCARSCCKGIRHISSVRLKQRFSKRASRAPEVANSSPAPLPECVEETPAKEAVTPRSPQASATRKKPSERFREVRVLGKGSFGTVRLAETESGAFVALKTIKLSRGQICDEAHVLSSLKHPCIVVLLESFETSTKRGCLTHLVMEYLPTTLQKQINGHPMSPIDCQCYGFQLFRALAHLQALQIAHCDVKPENLLIDRSKALKLADFGSAKRLAEEKYSMSANEEQYFCTRWWRAPELVLGCKRYGTAVDWWSAGCVLLEMMKGQPLFCGTSTGIQLDAIAQFLGTPTLSDLKAMLPCGSISGPQLAELAKPRHSPRPWADCLPAFRNNTSALALVSAIFVYNPAGRLSSGEALTHGFFSDLVNDPTLPTEIFNFTAEELSSVPASAKSILLSLKMSDFKNVAMANSEMDVDI